MGLTVHYTIKFDGTQKELVRKLNSIRSKCLDLPFQEVGEVKAVKITQNIINEFNSWQRNTNYPNNSEENLKQRDMALEKLGVSTWIMVEAGIFRQDENSCWRELKPTSSVFLFIWPGKGSESCDLNFYKRGKKFVAKSFCKTQYALDFKHCHLLVIKLLDMLKNEEGFDVEVHDEGKYWETRDMKVLAKELGDYRILVEKIGGQLKAAFGEENIQTAADDVFDDEVIPPKNR